MAKVVDIWGPRMGEFIGLRQRGWTFEKIAAHFGASLCATYSAWQKYKRKARVPPHRDDRAYQYFREQNEQNEIALAKLSRRIT